MKGPPFKTTTLHRPFNYGQRAQVLQGPRVGKKGNGLIDGSSPEEDPVDSE